MKVLVLGTGQIGAAILKAAPREHEVVVLGRLQLDILDADKTARTIVASKADWVVNAAAYTAVDKAEDESTVARAVNDTAVAVLAIAAQHAGARLLHLSTDYVFDGKAGHPYSPADSTNPLNVYGATKRAGELHVLKDPAGVVMRTSWVYASAGRNFVLTMIKLMKERSQINVVCDQIGAPTWAASAAAAVWALVTRGLGGGVYHWSDLGVASWYDFAVAIQEDALARQLLSRAIPITPISGAAYPVRAERPSYSVLSALEAHSLLGISGVHWRENLRRMLDELCAA